MNEKLYIVKYCANEYDDLAYDQPYPIYFTLDQNKAKEFFDTQVQKEKEKLNKYLENYPEFKDNEYYMICVDKNNEFEFNFGKWFYKYILCEREELEKDLRYN